MIPNNTQLKSLTLFSIYFTLKTTYPSDIKIACMTLFIKQVLPRLCNPVFPVSDLCVTFTRQVLLPAFWLVHLFSASFAWISFVSGCGKSYRKFSVITSIRIKAYAEGSMTHVQTLHVDKRKLNGRKVQWNLSAPKDFLHCDLI